MATRQLALLRGINVGKHKQLPMADLRALLEGLGYEDVATHLRSGNAVYTAAKAPSAAASEIEAAIAKRFGFDVDVVVRKAAEIDKVLERDPFADIATDGAKYLVVFLAEPPSAAMRKRLEELETSGEEQLCVEGREVYVWAPNGVNESKAWKALSGGDAVVGTGRNWNTVRKLAELLGI